MGSVANSILDSILYIMHQCFICSTLNIKKDILSPVCLIKRTNNIYNLTTMQLKVETTHPSPESAHPAHLSRDINLLEVWIDLAQDSVPKRRWRLTKYLDSGQMEWYFTNLDFPQNKGDFPYFSPPFGGFWSCFRSRTNLNPKVDFVDLWFALWVPEGTSPLLPPFLAKEIIGAPATFKGDMLFAWRVFTRMYIVPPLLCRGVKSFSAVTKKGEHVCLLAGFLGVKKATQILTWNASPTISQKLSSTQMDQLLLHVFQTFLQLLLCPVAQREHLGSMINGFVSSGWFSLTNPLVVVYLEIVNVLPFTVLNSFRNVCAVYLVAKSLVSHVVVGKLGCNHHENPW